MSIPFLFAGLAGGGFDLHDMELCLRRLSRRRRLAEQALNAAASLRGLNLSPVQAVNGA